MKIPAILAKQNPITLAIGGVIIIAAIYVLLRQVAKETAGVVGGIASGRNALTEGTVYDGKGVVGTVAAAANTTSGGALETVGSWIGNKVYDITHPQQPDRPIDMDGMSPAETAGSWLGNKVYDLTH